MTTESDTPETGSGDLTIDTATEAFLNLIDPPAEDADIKVDTEVDPPKKKEEGETPPEGVEEGDDLPITLTVDGKEVKLTKAEIAEHYKNGLRQGDYTQKTMALADQRRAAEEATNKAQQERASLAQQLARAQVVLEGTLQEQSRIDWDALLAADPVEFLKQQHLYNQRQAALQKNRQDQESISQQFQAEQAQAKTARLSTQQQELLAKLPEWKDSAKAETEREAIKTYLKAEGFDEKAIANIDDHRAVVMARKAMLYDQMMSKASAAAKKVANLPQKVERPGVSNETSDPDGRKAAMRRHAKSGTIDSLTEAFATFLN